VIAAFGLWVPDATFVEPAIALSIVYVGVENRLMKDVGRRWLITFPLGLVHGFGFAGALRALDLSSDRIVPALLSFNVGVEIGQVLVLAALLPGLAWLRRRPGLERPITGVLDVGVIVSGAIWFVWRLLALR
jgi:hypothetical protein